MKSTGKYDNIVSLCKSLGHFDGILICLSTAVGKENFFLLAFYGSNGSQLFSQSHIAFMGNNIKHSMEVFICLLLNSFHNLRLRISDIQYTDAANPVQELVAVHVLDHSSLTFLNDNRISTSNRCRCSCLSSFNHGCCFRSRHGLCDNFR